MCSTPSLPKHSRHRPIFIFCPNPLNFHTPPKSYAIPFLSFLQQNCAYALPYPYPHVQCWWTLLRHFKTVFWICRALQYSCTCALIPLKWHPCLFCHINASRILSISTQIFKSCRPSAIHKVKCKVTSFYNNPWRPRGRVQVYTLTWTSGLDRSWW